METRVEASVRNDVRRPRENDEFQAQRFQCFRELGNAVPKSPQVSVKMVFSNNMVNERSKTSVAVICDAEAPRSVNTAHPPESAFTVSPLNTPRPLYFWNFFSNSEFLR